MSQRYKTEEDFYFKPNFIIDSQNIINSYICPLELKSIWDMYIENNIFISKKDPMIRSLEAKTRYIKLHNYLHLANEFPILLQVLSESLFWLDDIKDELSVFYLSIQSFKDIDNYNKTNSFIISTNYKKLYLSNIIRKRIENKQRKLLSLS